ncbi:DUF2330 domain-containing protein [bacterium]|nr:DUF2330 domain-containing protein [bacterium]
MKRLIQLFIVILFSNLLLPSLALADGALIPPPGRHIYETDQNAVIFYEDGVETLIVSTKFRGDAEDFAWIIPTPNKPEVEKSTVELFKSLAEMTKVQNLSRPTNALKGIGYGYNEDAIQRVEVIETKKIAYYDISVLRAGDENALNEWLNEHGYQFPDSGNYILKDYIDNDWYFTAIKISGEYLSNNLNQSTRNGDLIPLSLQFKSDKIVFPLKISSIDYYYEGEDKKLEPYVERYQPVYDFLVSRSYQGSLLPTQWIDKNTEIIKVVTGLDNKLFEDIRKDRSYSESVASVTDFITEKEYSDVIISYQIRLKNYQDQGGSYPNLSVIKSAYFPEINQDLKKLHSLSSSNYKARNNPYIKLLVYIIADQVYDYSNFSVLYADFIKKDKIQDLATKDNGESWINPDKDKYVLTKLYRNMRQSEMSNDLYFKESDITLEDIGDRSLTGFYVFIIFTCIITFGLIAILIYFYKK